MLVGAVILAGGKGTRSANPQLPKIAQIVGPKSLLEWHLDALKATQIRDLVIVSGHLGDQVAELVHSVTSMVSYRDFHISVLEEADPQGTVAALRLGASSFPEPVERILVMLGDVLVAMPIEQFLRNWQESSKGVGVVAHPNTHPFDSDSVFVNAIGREVTLPKGSDKRRVPNSASAGLFLITRASLSHYPQARDLGSNLLVEAAEHNDLYIFTDSHYLKDTGTPERLEATNRDFENGVIDRKGSLGLRSALFLDRDGVINSVQPEVYQADDYKVLPGVAGEIKKANERGIPVFVVTNQPGIAKGLMSFEEHFEIRSELDAQLGFEQAFIDEYYFCPHHPDSGFEGERIALKIECECRKPNAALANLISRQHGIELPKSVMLGDTARDQGFARNAGMGFIHVSSSCDLESAHACELDSVQAIRRAVEELTC